MGEVTGGGALDDLSAQKTYKWSKFKCVKVAWAITLDYKVALDRLDNNLRRGIVRAKDKRLMHTLDASSSLAYKAGDWAALGDHEEANRLMHRAYSVWNQCRISLGLKEIFYGSIPENATRYFLERKAKIDTLKKKAAR